MIRDAAEADMPVILEIINDAIVNTAAVWTLAPTTLQARTFWWRERTEAGFPVLVAEIDGSVLGFASYGPFRPWEGYVKTVEHSVYVHRDARGRGCGRALLSAVVDHAMAAGKHIIIGGIEAGNIASMQLHASLGFIETGRLREVGRKFDRWLDLVFMQRTLG
jgi:L-amino acid N-acyltransferase YncA